MANLWVKPEPRFKYAANVLHASTTKLCVSNPQKICSYQVIQKGNLNCRGGLHFIIFLDWSLVSFIFCSRRFYSIQFGLYWLNETHDCTIRWLQHLLKAGTSNAVGGEWIAYSSSEHFSSQSVVDNCFSGRLLKQIKSHRFCRDPGS